MVSPVTLEAISRRSASSSGTSATGDVITPRRIQSTPVVAAVVICPGRKNRLARSAGREKLFDGKPRSTAARGTLREDGPAGSGVLAGGDQAAGSGNHYTLAGGESLRCSRVSAGGRKGSASAELAARLSRLAAGAAAASRRPGPFVQHKSPRVSRGPQAG